MNKTFRKICAKLHLYLGLLSGLVVFIVCITGCLYVFKNEINEATQPWRFVAPEQTEALPPSVIISLADSVMNGEISATAITYGEQTDAVFVDYHRRGEGQKTVFLNPYNGKIQKTIMRSADDFDFFRFVIRGHRSLWLPKQTGSVIVGYSVLAFFIALIAGLILWWPPQWTRRALMQRLTMKRPFTFPRLNFDLHRILGFYAFLPLFVICFTGLIFSLGWFNKSFYAIVSGGEGLQPNMIPVSDTLQTSSRVVEPLDSLFYRLKAESPEAKKLSFSLPSKKDGVFRVSVGHRRGSRSRTDYLFFDRHTLKPLQGSGPFTGKYEDASVVHKLRRMNLELHDGSILGLFGKSIMFLASLIGASLPITGFVIWHRKNRRKMR